MVRRLSRVWLVVVAATAAPACTTVKLAQRDGCWVRQTHKTLHGTQEDVGPCVRPPPKWSEDRLTRLVQECVAQADYRWQGRALAAWSRYEPMPPRDTQETVITTCMGAAAAGVVTQNETLQQRLAELSGDREALRTQATAADAHLRHSADRLVEFLGEAAKRPPPVATATATSTSDGTAKTENHTDADASGSGAAQPAGTLAAQPPIVPAAAAPGAPSAAPPAVKPKTTDAARAARKRALARAARGSGCDVPVTARAADAEPSPQPAAAPPEPSAGADGAR